MTLSDSPREARDALIRMLVEAAEKEEKDENKTIA